MLADIYGLRPSSLPPARESATHEPRFLLLRKPAEPSPSPEPAPKPKEDSKSSSKPGPKGKPGPKRKPRRRLKSEARPSPSPAPKASPLRGPKGPLRGPLAPGSFHGRMPGPKALRPTRWAGGSMRWTTHTLATAPSRAAIEAVCERLAPDGAMRAARD